MRLPWTATTFGRRDYRGPFYGADENTCCLLCKVSSYYDRCSFLPLKDWICQCRCRFLLPAHCFLSDILNGGMSIFHLPLHATTVYHLYRNILWAFSFMLGFFRFWTLCSCACWDPAWFLAFENFTLNSWPTQTQQPAWPQSLFKSMCIWLAVVYEGG